MLICGLCGSVSVWTICWLTEACSLSPSYLAAPVSLLLPQLWASPLLSPSFPSFFSLFKSCSFFFLLSRCKNSLPHHFPTLTLSPQLSFLYESLLSLSKCPWRSAQIVPSSYSSSSCCSNPPSFPASSSMRHSGSAQLVTDFSSVSASEGQRRGGGRDGGVRQAVVTVPALCESKVGGRD